MVQKLKLILKNEHLDSVCSSLNTALYRCSFKASNSLSLSAN